MPDRFSCLDVDREPEFGRLLHREIFRLFAIQDACDVNTNSAVGIAKITPIADETPPQLRTRVPDKRPVTVCRAVNETIRSRCDCRECICADQQSFHIVPTQIRKCAVDLIRIARFQNHQMQSQPACRFGLPAEQLLRERGFAGFTK